MLIFSPLDFITLLYSFFSRVEHLKCLARHDAPCSTRPLRLITSLGSPVDLRISSVVKVWEFWLSEYAHTIQGWFYFLTSFLNCRSFWREILRQNLLVRLFSALIHNWLDEADLFPSTNASHFLDAIPAASLRHGLAEHLRIYFLFCFPLLPYGVHSCYRVFLNLVLNLPEYWWQCLKYLTLCYLQHCQVDFASACLMCGLLYGEC